MILSIETEMYQGVPDGIILGEKDNELFWAISLPLATESQDSIRSHYLNLLYYADVRMELATNRLYPPIHHLDMDVCIYKFIVPRDFNLFNFGDKDSRDNLLEVINGRIITHEINDKYYKLLLLLKLAFGVRLKSLEEHQVVIREVISLYDLLEIPFEINILHDLEKRGNIDKCYHKYNDILVRISIPEIDEFIITGLCQANWFIDTTIDGYYLPYGTNIYLEDKKFHSEIALSHQAGKEVIKANENPNNVILDVYIQVSEW